MGWNGGTPRDHRTIDFVDNKDNNPRGRERPQRLDRERIKHEEYLMKIALAMIFVHFCRRYKTCCPKITLFCQKKLSVFAELQLANVWKLNPCPERCQLQDLFSKGWFCKETENILGDILCFHRAVSFS